VRDTFEKSIVGLPYIVAFAVEVHDGVERIVVLRVIHTARHWPPGQWPKP
jgi:toxin ParE1/3/4